MNIENTLNKEQVQELVKEFRTVFHNKELRPKLEPDGYGGFYKKDGLLQLKHYILYALIRNKDPLLCVKDKEHLLKDEILYAFKENQEILWWRKVFPSLTKEQFNLLLINFNNMV